MCNNSSFCGSTKLGDTNVYLFYLDGTFTGGRGDQPTPGAPPTPVLRKVAGTYHIAPGSTGMNDFFIDETTFTFLGGGGGPATTDSPFTLNLDLGVPAVAEHYTFSEAPPPWAPSARILPRREHTGRGDPVLTVSARSGRA